MVVAACTPRTHEPLFRDTLREAGINQYFFDMANIREHCSWVHSKEQADATKKAKDIVRMSVARASLLEPLDEFSLPVNKAALVVGGGVAGMTSALTLAEQGFQTYLIEKASDLGGMARRIHFTVEGLDVQAYLKDLMKRTYRHQLIRVITDATITACRRIRRQFHHQGEVQGPGAGDQARGGHHRHRRRRVQADRVPVRTGRRAS